MKATTINMRGKICLVTGATRGIGQATALKLARLGARVIVVGRSRSRIENTLALLRAEWGADTGADRSKAAVESIRADLSSMAEVCQAAAEVLGRCDRLDLLVNNVGATLLRYQESPDGHEMTWALNYLGHFLLTHELIGLLKATAAHVGEARVVEVTSSMCRYGNPRFTHLQARRGYNGVLAYAQSKTAINMYAAELARRLRGAGVTINAVTPGYVRTDISQNSFGLYKLAFAVVNRFSMDLNEGVQPLVWMATAPELCGASGDYYYRFQRRKPSPAWNDPVNVANLWATSEAMTGLAMERA